MAEETKNTRKKPKLYTGVVMKDKMDKTRVVHLTRLVKHKLYGKYVKKFTKCHVHDPANTSKKGDKVRIVETRPLSKLKRYRLVEVLDK